MKDVKDVTAITIDNHVAEKRMDYIEVIYSDNVNPKIYAIYLYNQYHIYSTLESHANKFNLFSATPALPRAENAFSDYQVLWDESEPPPKTQSTLEFIQHLQNISEQPHLLYTNIYARHMGTMRASSIIKEKTPGQNSLYDFPKEQIAQYSNVIRNKLNEYCTDYGDDILQEVSYSFDVVEELLKELTEISNTKISRPQ